ncbi:ATP-binding protein [Myxococcus sp. K15C18031901]|uniref:ATP-binding protein n=1 Tax=Myxococcus dinghuensis TaxID=2906761 RepID=UPI0020A78B7C|nr:ATP-binding protein [Myxococcus dinghuensis]MCP3097297.1 ATP-binding protein [Myxococcus dinghuensis]
MALLIYNRGQADERRYELGVHPIHVGRAPECEVSITHRGLSRIHARIEQVDSRFILTDLDSKNGTFINGGRVQHQELQDEDTVLLGNASFTFVLEHRPARPGAVQRPVEPEEPQDTSALRPTVVREMLRLDLEQLLGRTKHLQSLQREAALAKAQDKLQILLEVSRILGVPGSLEVLFQKVLDVVFRIFDADRSVILLIDPQSGLPEAKASRSTRGPPSGPVSYSQRIVEYVRVSGLAALFSDAVEDPRIDDAASVIHHSIRAVMCVPLKPRDDVMGILYVDNLSVPNRFSEEDLEFLVIVASHAALAIENSMLYRRIEQETSERMRLIMEAKLASLGALVSGVAHELRNPLNFMNNFAGLSEELVAELSSALVELPRLPEPDALPHIQENLTLLSGNIARIREHGRRADSVIQGMLMHARGKTGGRSESNLNAMLAESVRLAAGGRGYAELQVHVEAEYAPSLERTQVVGTDLSRVFINIVDNALYAMQQKRLRSGPEYVPVLRVQTQQTDQHLLVRIRDNGTGIREEDLARIFDPFFSTKPPGQGTGLGLSLSHDIVVQGHRGTLRAESVLGSFTEFIIALPNPAPAAPSRAP